MDNSSNTLQLRSPSFHHLFTKMPEYDYDSDSTVGDGETPRGLSLPRAFSSLPSYIENLEYPKTRLLGYLNSEPVFVVLVGFIHPKSFAKGTQVIRGRCSIQPQEGSYSAGYCIGIIMGTSTGVIISREGRMYVYTLPERREVGWNEVEGHVGAEVLFNTEREMRLRFLPDLKIESNEYIR